MSDPKQPKDAEMEAAVRTELDEAIDALVADWAAMGRDEGECRLAIVKAIQGFRLQSMRVRAVKELHRALKAPPTLSEVTADDC